MLRQGVVRQAWEILRYAQRNPENKTSAISGTKFRDRWEFIIVRDSSVFCDGYSNRKHGERKRGLEALFDPIHMIEDKILRLSRSSRRM
jgi:hypothetical protein